MKTYTNMHSHKIVYGVQHLCRLCMAPNKDKIPIFPDKKNLYSSLAARIMTCVGIEIKSEEYLPNTICMECHTKLNDFYEFKKKCGLTYRKLKSHKIAVTKIKGKGKDANELKKINSCENVVPESRELPGINTYEELVTVTVGEEPLQIKITALPYETAAENTPDVPKTAKRSTNHESVIKYLPKQSSTAESAPKPMPPVDPDMAQFLSSLLLELRVLKTEGDEILLKDPTLRTVEIEAGDETIITLNMLEIQEEMPLATSYTTQSGDAQSELSPTPAEERVQCPECGKRFASSGALRRHARVHSGDRPFVCSVCQRSFGQKEVMVRHQLVHKEERPHKCASCPKSFTQRGGLAAHARTHAGAAALALHSCTKCSKVFLHASGLSRHMMVHNGRVYSCGACARRFNDQSSLLRHLRVKHKLDTTSAPTTTATITTTTEHPPATVCT